MIAIDVVLPLFQVKGNKLQLIVDQYEFFNMILGESIDEFEAQFLSIMSEMNSLEKIYSNNEMNDKVLSRMTAEWEIKVVATKEARGLKQTTPREMFASLKAYEYDLQRKKPIELRTCAPDVALYAERNRNKGHHQRNNSHRDRQRNHHPRDNHDSTSTDRDKRPIESKESLTEMIASQIQKLKERQLTISNQRIEEKSSRQIKESVERRAKKEVECYHCHKSGHYIYDCPDLPEETMEKVRKCLNKRKTTLAEMASQVLDDSDYPSDTDSNGYESDEGTLFYLMAKVDDEVSTAESKTSHHSASHIKETESVISHSEADFSLHDLQNQLASICVMHTQLSKENEQLRDEVMKLVVGQERMQVLESQQVELTELRGKVHELTVENQVLKEKIMST